MEQPTGDPDKVITRYLVHHITEWADVVRGLAAKWCVAVALITANSYAIYGLD